MAKNLITGGTGFTGVYLARQLLEEGEEVLLFQRRSTLPANAADLNGKVKIVSGDVSNWVHVADAVKSNNVDRIYHSAALLTIDCEDSPAAGFRVNIVGTMNILEAARILNVEGVAYVSTREPLMALILLVKSSMIHRRNQKICTPLPRCAVNCWASSIIAGTESISEV